MRSSVLLAFVASLAVLLTAPADAEAQASRDLEAIRAMTFEARFDDAIRAARTFLDRSDVSAAERNAGLEVLAVAQIANGDRDDATQTLTLLYSRDPAHRLTDPDASPPVISAFARAREARPAPVPVALAHEPPTLTRRVPPSIEVRVQEGDDAVAEVRLSYRAGTEPGAEVVMSRRADGVFTARIPVIGDPSTPTDVAYHLIALAPSMSPLATLGSAAEPLQLRIPAESSGGAAIATVRDPSPAQPPPPEPSDGGSVAEQWWFWTILVGLVAVGVGVTVGVVLGPAQQRPDDGTLGTVTLMQLEL